MKIYILLIILALSSQVIADDCRSILTIGTDDSIYPGEGEVQICVNSKDQLTKLVVIKPVKNPGKSDPTSGQPDERNPVVHIKLEDFNQTMTNIAIMTPQRFGITVNAAYLQKPTAPVSRDTGGEVVLKVLKNKMLGTYHFFRLRLMKVNGEFKGYLVKGDQLVPLSHAFFRSGVSGIKSVDFY